MTLFVAIDTNGDRGDAKGESGERRKHRGKAITDERGHDCGDDKHDAKGDQYAINARKRRFGTEEAARKNCAAQTGECHAARQRDIAPCGKFRPHKLIAESID